MPDPVTTTRKGRWKAIMTWLVVLLLLIAAAYLAGPRVAIDTRVAFDPAAIGSDPEAYLAAREGAVAGIRDGQAKEIVWAYPTSKARTPLAIVYIHGFSASSGEIRPVPDRVAAELGANLHFTRLTGHGRDAAAMAEARVNDWINDYAEAVAIGRRIGERVIVMATSTGGGLATWAATQAALSEGVAGYVLISPNYRLRGAGSSLLAGPWGAQIARLAIGEERVFTPRNALHARLWTPRYPVSALLPMAALTKLAHDAAVEEIATPALFLYSAADAIVDARATADIAARWGGRNQSLPIDGSGDASNHVIAGDALSPQTNDRVVAAIVEWANLNF